MEKAPSSTNRMTNDTHSSLRNFFVDELKDIYWAENHLVKTLPKMADAATNNELKKGFNDHLLQTKEHVTRLEEIFALLNEKAEAKKCDAMEGITKEGDNIIDETAAGTSTRDVGLIMAAQKVEHYEIATYGSLAQLADTLEMDKVVHLLKKTLDEEKQADKNLSELAENKINHLSVEEVAS